MSDDFDYGGEVASNGGFKQPPVGTRKARLAGLLRLGTFRETFMNGKVAEIKDPAPQAVAIFHLMGKADLSEDAPVYFTKPFPMKKGDKSFLHKTFIPAMGGMSKHKSFVSMITQMASITLKPSAKLNEDGSPKYVNFDTVSAMDEETIELHEANAANAPLEGYVGFLKEDELTEEALALLHPTREFAGILMKTEEFKAGKHPSQALIQGIFDANPERYTYKDSDKDDADSDAGDGQQNKAQTPPAEVEQMQADKEF